MHPSEGAPGTGSSSSSSGGAAVFDGGGESTTPDIWSSPGRRSVSVGGEPPSGGVLRTGSSRGKWGSPDRRGGCGAREHPSGGEGKQESSTLDGSEVVSAAVVASQERSSPDLAGKDSEAAEPPALEVGGTTAYRYRCALGCGGHF